MKRWRKQFKFRKKLRSWIWVSQKLLYCCTYLPIKLCHSNSVIDIISFESFLFWFIEWIIENENKIVICSSIFNWTAIIILLLHLKQHRDLIYIKGTWSCLAFRKNELKYLYFLKVETCFLFSYLIFSVFLLLVSTNFCNL